MKGDLLQPTLAQLIRRAEQLKTKDFLGGYREFADWHDECVEHIEGLVLEFRELVRTPLDVEDGISWLKANLRER